MGPDLSKKMNAEEKKLKELLLEKIKTLNETIWEHNIGEPKINRWLNNFSDEREKLHMLFLLSQFMYFGSIQMRHLLRTLFEELFKYRVIESIRKSNDNTTQLAQIKHLYEVELKNTRFLGIGNPSESGPHLLYYFRQENKLPKSIFIQTHDIFKRLGNSQLEIANVEVKRYVFIDDFCGSGSQACQYSERIVRDLKILLPEAQVDYIILFSTKEGKEYVIDNTDFDFVDSIFELDKSFKCFDTDSRYFDNIMTSINKSYCMDSCRKYGERLMYSICKLEGAPEPLLIDCAKHNAFGYKDGQLLLGLHHNTPDNTLPIIWYDEDEIAWEPIFRRYNKKYD